MTENQKIVSQVRELVEDLEDRSGDYSSSELIAAAILKAAAIISDESSKHCRGSMWACLRSLLSGPKRFPHYRK